MESGLDLIHAALDASGSLGRSRGTETGKPPFGAGVGVGDGYSGAGGSLENRRPKRRRPAEVKREGQGSESEDTDDGDPGFEEGNPGGGSALRAPGDTGARSGGGDSGGGGGGGGSNGSGGSSGGGSGGGGGGFDDEDPYDEDRRRRKDLDDTLDGVNRYNGLHLTPFLVKLVEIVRDKDNDKIISYGPEGKGIIIISEVKLAEEILPRYFKHSNVSSFIRQLNLYGFRKHGKFRSGICFYHEFFDRGRPELLEKIKRFASPSAALGRSTTFPGPQGQQGHGHGHPHFGLHVGGGRGLDDEEDEPVVSLSSAIASPSTATMGNGGAGLGSGRRKPGVGPRAADMDGGAVIGVNGHGGGATGSLGGPGTGGGGAQNGPELGGLDDPAEDSRAWRHAATVRGAARAAASAGERGSSLGASAGAVALGFAAEVAKEGGRRKASSASYSAEGGSADSETVPMSLYRELMDENLELRGLLKSAESERDVLSGKVLGLKEGLAALKEAVDLVRRVHPEPKDTKE